MKRETGAEAGELAAAMVALVRAFGLHRPHETPCGQPIPVAEAHALMDLAAGAPLNHRELAARLQLEKSTVSRLVRQLEKRRWIARAPAGHDRRVVRIRLTAAGKRAAARLARARHAKFNQLLVAIPKEKRKVVLDAMSALVKALEE